jgi:hypothetical protein
MRELVNLLDLRERKTLSTLAVFFGLVVATLLIFAGRAEVKAGRASRRMAEAESRAGEAVRTRDAAKAEFERWRKAAADVRELGASWFYNRAEGDKGFYQDLRAVFNAAGVVVPEISYADVELVKGRLRRETAEFRLSASYLMLRRLLETVENHPRALHVERVDFEDVGTLQPGLLQVRIVLAGYLLHAE